MAMRLKIEQRVEVPKWLPIATSVGSVLIAFLIGGLVLKFVGGKPLEVLSFFFQAVFGNWGVFSDTLVKATPLIIIGVACAVAFKMRLWNIGAEGQFYAGAFGASMVVLVPLISTGKSQGDRYWNDDDHGDDFWGHLGIYSWLFEGKIQSK